MTIALPWNDRAGKLSPLKAAVFAAAFVPVLMLAWWLPSGQLGPRPLTVAIHHSGDWAIRFLLISLAVTPLRRIGQWPKLILVRRMLGLAALAYALLHIVLYAFDQKLDLSRVASEILLRIYLTIGFVALLGLIVLGITSTDAAIRRLGGNWNRLHRIVYALAALAVIHFFMQTKADVFEATLMAGLFALLMLYRLAHWRGFSIQSPFVLVAIALLGGVLTAAAEYVWYATATGIPPLRVLAANLDFSYQVRPAWWVVAAGLGVAALAFARPFFGEKKTPRDRRRSVPA